MGHPFLFSSISPNAGALHQTERTGMIRTSYLRAIEDGLDNIVALLQFRSDVGVSACEGITHSRFVGCLDFDEGRVLHIGAANLIELLGSIGDGRPRLYFFGSLDFG
jgi:hypothetical protein